MAVYKRKKSRFWWYSIYLPDGRPRLCGSTGKEDLNEALAVEAVLRQAHAGTSTRDRLVSVIDALSGGRRDGLPLVGIWDGYYGWVSRSGKGLSGTTIRQRRRVCSRFAEWAAKHWTSVRVAGAVDRACANGFAESLSKSGVADKTRRNVIADLSTIWEGLRRVRDDVTTNPWPLVLPSANSERLAAFSKSEERRVLEAADRIGHGWGLACRIARYTGLRYGDVAMLRWDNVDLEKRVVNVVPSKTARHGVTVRMPICSVLHDTLVKAFACRGGSEHVLPEHADWYNNRSKSPAGPFSSVLLKAGVSGNFTFHSWRHTFRTRLAEAGVSDEIAKRLGGWTVDKTAMRYDHDGRITELTAAVEAGAMLESRTVAGSGGPGKMTAARRIILARERVIKVP